MCVKARRYKLYSSNCIEATVALHEGQRNKQGCRRRGKLAAMGILCEAQAGRILPASCPSSPTTRLPSLPPPSSPGGNGPCLQPKKIPNSGSECVISVLLLGVINVNVSTQFTHSVCTRRKGTCAGSVHVTGRLACEGQRSADLSFFFFFLFFLKDLGSGSICICPFSLWRSRDVP